MGYIGVSHIFSSFNYIQRQRAALQAQNGPFLIHLLHRHKISIISEMLKLDSGSAPSKAKKAPAKKKSSKAKW